jgi:hypothetical protein
MVMIVKPAAVFCERWHDREHRPGTVISELAARHRDAQGQPYTVVLGNPDQPDAVIDVNWSLDYLGTWFLDEKLRRNIHYAFARVDSKTLFLQQIILWEYPDEAVRGIHTATKITTLTYDQDGIVHEAIDDAVAAVEEVVSRSDVPLDMNWEQVPEFGDWSRVARRDRESG